MRKLILIGLCLLLPVVCLGASRAEDVTEYEGEWFDTKVRQIGWNNGTGQILISTDAATHCIIKTIIRVDDNGYDIFIDSHVNISTATALAPADPQEGFLNMGGILLTGDKLSFGKLKAAIYAICPISSSTVTLYQFRKAEPGWERK